MTLNVAEPATRESHRRQLAALLGQDPASLPDHTRLIEDLALDSLAMMRIIVWLEGHGVVVGPDRSGLTRLGDLLSLVDTVADRGVSIRVSADERLGPMSATDVPAPVRRSGDPLAPVLEGHGVHLLPVGSDDVGFLYALAAAPETGFRWRYRGVPPSPERFADDLWKQVLVQYVARRTEDDEPVGQVVAYGADPAMRFVYVGAVFAPPHTGAGLAAHAVAMFVRYLFHSFPIVKVYLEVPEYNWGQISSGAGVQFDVEGVLREHHFYAGRLWDQYLCAIYRDRLTAR